MKTVKLFQISLIVSWALVLAACASAPAAEAPTVTEGPTATATEVTPSIRVLTRPPSTPSPTPVPVTDTPTPFPQPTATVPRRPTPVLPDAMRTDFLFGGVTDECQLPCWRGLVVGRSTSDEVDSTLNTLFALNGIVDFTDRTNLYPDIPELYGNGYAWDFSRDPASFFAIAAWMHTEDDILQAFEFSWKFVEENPLDSSTSPEHLLEVFGTPAHMLLRIQIGERGDQGSLSIIMIYESGIIYDGAVYVPIDGSAAVCLGGQRWDGVYNSAQRWFFITEPIRNDLSQLTPIQDVFYRIALDGREFHPIETLFDLTLEELTERAQTEYNPCLYLQIHPDTP